MLILFRNVEQKVGVHKLLKLTAGEKVFTSPSTSVHTLALIAIAKLLSPSHAAHSISLYNEYTASMQAHDIAHEGFKGFVANRFGRIAEIAKEYLQRHQSILDFFDAVVDVNSNKLVLAVSTYIQCEWFFCCSEVYTMLGEIVIFPLMDLLGIDKRTETCFDKTWSGMRQFFREGAPTGASERIMFFANMFWKRETVCSCFGRSYWHYPEPAIRNAILYY